MSVIQPTKCTVLECTIGGMPFRHLTPTGPSNNFHIQELRIYEDNCKFYFTGQLVIESHLNTFEMYLVPQALVTISFVAPPNGKIYTERFRVYSYESKPREGDIQNAMVITISLIGDEYYKDKSKQVQQNFPNVTATTAAAEIHKLIQHNGSLKVPQESIGMIGLDKHPHQVLSKQPSKAIHDLLDKAIMPVPSIGPAIYYRDKNGYQIVALEYIMRTAPVTGNFIHQPAQGSDLAATLEGYDRVIHFRPMAPPGEDRGGARQVEFEGLAQALSSLDLGKGNAHTGPFASASGILKNLTDSYRQLPQVDKAGPGGFQAKENAFIAKLTYSPKYWVSVPLQTGINVTVGNRISVVYPINDKPYEKTLWVSRLIHELRFTEGKDRSVVTVNGTTDLFGVWLQ